jgi:hypothetical protein
MPPRATLEQRVAWHREHQLACACRPIPAKLRALMDGDGKPKPSTAEAKLAREAHASAAAPTPARKRAGKQARVTKLTARKKRARTKVRAG